MVPVAGIPPPPPPELTAKMVYEPMSPALYLSLWDAIKYMDKVSAIGWVSGIASKQTGPRRYPNGVLG